jgi:hypothetical protein
MDSRKINQGDQLKDDEELNNHKRSEWFKDALSYVLLFAIYTSPITILFVLFLMYQNDKASTLANIAGFVFGVFGTIGIGFFKKNIR